MYQGIMYHVPMVTIAPCLKAWAFTVNLSLLLTMVTPIEVLQFHFITRLYLKEFELHHEGLGFKRDALKFTQNGSKTKRLNGISDAP